MKRAPFLIALVATTALAAPAFAANYFYRSKPEVISAPVPAGPDLTPDVVTFPTLANQEANAVVTSNVVRLTGHAGVAVSVSSNTGAALRTCADAACTLGVSAWANSATAATDAYLQLRQNAPAALGTATATLTYGTLTATWQVGARAAGTCAGDYMRMRLPTGFEALICGIAAAPANLTSGADATGGYLFSASKDGCNRTTQTILRVNPSIGVEKTFDANPYSPGNCTDLGSGDATWVAATGSPKPSSYIVVSKGTPPGSYTAGYAITWSK